MHGAAPAEFPDWLSYRAATSPQRAALVADGRTWTFAELHAGATRAARQLASLGVSPGDRVATLLRNGAAPAVLLHAVLRLGATLVPLNTRLTAPELAWQLDDSAPRLLVTDDDMRSLADAACSGIPALRMATMDRAGLMGTSDAPAVALRDALPADHVLAVIYTSGTTGRPKGAMLTVANFWWSAMGSALNLGVHDDDRWLACLPLFHVGGLSILLRSAIYGTTAVVHDGFDEAVVNRALDEERVTMVSVVAVMLQRMLDARGNRPYPRSLRCVLLGGGPAPRALLERCAALGVPVVQTYGLTETTSQLATLAPEDALRKLGSAGRALYPNEVRIAHPDGDDDQAGEILVRGPVVMAGYAGQADAPPTGNAWFHTGDIGRLDVDGYLYVLDRRDDLIVTGGENVYPAEVESALLSHPLVAEAGVVGVPDERWGQRVVAVVHLVSGRDDPGPTDEVLLSHCRATLAGYKLPREILRWSEPLPRTAAGKLRRAELRKMLRRDELSSRA